MGLNIGADYGSFRAEVSEFIAERWNKELTGNRHAEAAFHRETTKRVCLYRAVLRSFGGAGQRNRPAPFNSW